MKNDGISIHFHQLIIIGILRQRDDLRIRSLPTSPSTVPAPTFRPLPQYRVLKSVRASHHGRYQGTDVFLASIQSRLMRLRGQDTINAIILDPGYADYLAILKAARNGAVYGAKVRFPHALV